MRRNLRAFETVAVTRLGDCPVWAAISFALYPLFISRRASMPLAVDLLTKAFELFITLYKAEFTPVLSISVELQERI